MDNDAAIRALGALAQASRLEAFRLLVRAGDAGLPAGEIARALGVPHNTLSTHLGILGNADLVRSRREGRRVIYRADFDGTRALLGFLLEDCCQGSPELCAPVLDSMLTECCTSGSREGMR
jgi:DNA-binding transcriptional ArsR family regulator